MMAETTLVSGSIFDITSFGEVFDVIKPVQTVMIIATFIAAKKFKVSALKLIFIMGILGAFLCKGEIL